MLGEAALTRDDADRYLQAYHDAIAATGRNDPFENEISAPSITVKLSSLHPRYDHTKLERLLAVLASPILHITQRVKQPGTGITSHPSQANPPEPPLTRPLAASDVPSMP